MLVQLTGPREGLTVKLGGIQFVEGVADIDGGAFLYFHRSYEVVPYNGPSNDEAADAERSGEEVSSESDVQSDEHEPAEALADSSEGPASDEAGAEGSLPSGDGHEDAGERDPEVDEDPLGAALAQLDPDNDDHWRADGRPAVAALAQITGGMVTKAMVEERFEGGDREAAKQGE